MIAFLARLLGSASKVLGSVNPGRPYIKVHGVPELKDTFDDLSESWADEAEAAMEETLARLLAESQEIVPYETGELHDSGFYEVERQGNRITGRVGYTAPHAWAVHENPEAEHDPGKQWKFLEGPALRDQPEMLKRIGSAIRSSLSRFRR